MLDEYGTMEILVSDLSPGSCVICDRERGLRSMHRNYIYKGRNECYTDIILQVFNVKMVGLGQEDTQSDICIKCIKRLREAFQFRKLIESIDQHYYGNITFENIPFVENKKKVSKPKISQDVEEVKAELKEILPIEGGSGNNSDWNDSEGKYDNNSLLSDTDSDLFIGGKKTEKIDIPPLQSSSTVCPVCNEKFQTFRDLRGHYAMHFPHYICDVCGTAYTKLYSLKVHLETHSNPKKYPCKLCDRTYKQLAGLRDHMKVNHQGIKRFVRCRKCREKFSKIKEKNDHEEKVHGLEIRKYACATCDRTFLRASHRAEHIKRDHLQQRRFACMHCDSKFFCKFSLKEHMLKHTGERNFHCDKCGKSYGRRTTLVEHLKIHADIRAHKCTVCSMAFIQKCSLKGHMKTHHSDKTV